MHKNQEIYHICYDYGVKIFIQMVAKTSECRINTESFSHASGSVPAKYISMRNQFSFFPRQWECSKKEAKTLAGTLFGIREYRCFTTSYFSPEEGAVSGQMELPKTIYKEELNDAKEELYYVCIQVVENRGSIVTRLIKKDHAKVFGIRVLPFGVWSPISKEEMQEASLVTPNGIELEPEESVIYTDIQRERF